MFVVLIVESRVGGMEALVHGSYRLAAIVFDVLLLRRSDQLRAGRNEVC